MTGLNRDALKKLRAERDKLFKDGKSGDVERAFEQINKKMPEKTSEEADYNPFEEDEFKSFDPTSSVKK